MPSHGVRLGSSGQLEVVRAGPPEDVHRLRGTLDRLRRAAGTGAVEVLEVADDGTSIEIVLGFAGKAVSAPVRAEELARVGAALAATLADLHGRGLVHGAVQADHVLIDAVGVVRVCGFGGVDGAEPADDVHALGVLLRELLDPDDRTDAARALRGIADRCCATDATARPSVAAVAASLASSGHARREVARPQPMATRRRHAPIVGVVGGIALTLVLAFGLWPHVIGAQAHHTRRATRPAHRATTTSTTTVPVRRVWPAAAPHVIDANGQWTFGTDDDRVLLLDFDCDGIDTPVLVQPGGAVYAVDQWTDGARARFVTVVHDVVDVAVAKDAGCDSLVLTTADRQTVTPDLNEA